MALTGTQIHTWRQTVTVPGLPALPADAPLVIAGNYAVEVEASIPATSTTEIDIGTVDRTKLVSLVFNAATGALIVNTNTASASAGQSITLSPSKTFAWNNTLDSTAFPNPISTNISKFFVINAGSASVTFRAGMLLSV